MVALITLFLSHLIADFPLQTNYIYFLKKTSSWGIILHAAIHALVAFLLTGLRWDLWYVWLFLLGTHAIIDWAKLRYKSPKQWTGFLLDQLLHLLIMSIIVLWQPSLSSILPGWILYPAFVLAWIPAILMFLWVYASDVVRDHPNPSRTALWMRENLLQTSRLSGYPCLVLALGGLLSNFPILL